MGAFRLVKQVYLPGMGAIANRRAGTLPATPRPEQDRSAPTEEPIFGAAISVYSRAQAIADGFLVDVSSVAAEAGLCLPVALTRAVWDLCVTVPRGTTCQDQSGRLWDVVWMLYLAIRRSRGDRLTYSLLVRKGRRLYKRTLSAVCGPGDEGEPVITVMLPEED